MSLGSTILHDVMQELQMFSDLLISVQNISQKHVHLNTYAKIGQLVGVSHDQAGKVEGTSRIPLACPRLAVSSQIEVSYLDQRSNIFQ